MKGSLGACRVTSNIGEIVLPWRLCLLLRCSTQAPSEFPLLDRFDLIPVS